MTLGQPTHYAAAVNILASASPANAGTRHIFVDSHPLVLQMLACTTQVATSLLCAHQILGAQQSAFSRHAELLHSCIAAKSL